MMEKDIFYSFDKLFSRSEFLIAFVIGERGCGKSYGIKKTMLKRWLKTGEEFIYLRRYKTELDTALTTFWDDLVTNDEFVGHSLTVDKSKMLSKFKCDGKVCGYAVPLSTANILKSTPFPKVGLMVYDEFLLDGRGTYKYLRNEVMMLLDTIESVFRLRDGKTVLLGNALNVHACPYFAYWNLELPEGDNEFRTFEDGAIVVNYIKNLRYREAKKRTKFGKLVEHSSYGEYAINNKVYNENNSFLKKKPSNAVFYGLLVINGVNIGVWSGRDGLVYLSGKYDPNTMFKFVFDENDHNESTIYLSVRENMIMSHCVRCYKQGWLRFDNQKIKSLMMKILNKCIAI